jgi:hypothetical protein
MSNSVSEDNKTSINIIANELLNIYNSFQNPQTTITIPTTSTPTTPTIDNFEVLPITENDVASFETVKKKIIEDGYNINFTIFELHETIKKLEIKANLLSLNERTNRKKILLFLLEVLNKNKDLTRKNIDNLFSKYQTSIENQPYNGTPITHNSFTQGQNENFNTSIGPNQTLTREQIKNNMYAFYDLTIYIVELFIKEINDIENPIICSICPICSTCPVNDNTKFYIIIGGCVFVIFFLLILLFRNK